MPEEAEVKKSAFNAGIGQTMRVHELQLLINSCRVNPLLFSDKYQARHFQIIVNCLDSLAFEVFPKCDDKEKEQLAKIKTIVRENLMKNPVFRRWKSQEGEGTIVVPENWANVWKNIENYEEFVRILLDNHGLNAPDIEGEGLF